MCATVIPDRSSTSRAELTPTSLPIEMAVFGVATEGRPRLRKPSGGSLEAVNFAGAAPPHAMPCPSLQEVARGDCQDALRRGSASELDGHEGEVVVSLLLDAELQDLLQDLAEVAAGLADLVAPISSMAYIISYGVATYCHVCLPKYVKTGQHYI